MYWHRQEEVMFDLVLVILILFQILLFFDLKSAEDSLLFDIMLAGLIMLLSTLMVPYAKWVWKTASYKEAFLRVIMHEMFILGIIAFAVITEILFVNMKGHA